MGNFICKFIVRRLKIKVQHNITSFIQGCKIREGLIKVKRSNRLKGLYL